MTLERLSGNKPLLASKIEVLFVMIQIRQLIRVARSATSQIANKNMYEVRHEHTATEIY